MTAEGESVHREEQAEIPIRGRSGQARVFGFKKKARRRRL